jgi:GNAT superfamily N-acetyltransferase
MAPVRLTSEPQASPEDVQSIRDRLDQFNVDVTGENNYSPVRIFLRDEDNKLVGGLLAEIWAGWMHVEFLWIDEPFRQNGFATQLLQAAETEARQKGCTDVFLETFSFQARPFYERFGYIGFGELPDYPPGQAFYFLRKTL